MAQPIQIRRDTATAWTAANPVLAQGELAAELVDGAVDKVKIGDGATAWNGLAYLSNFAPIPPITVPDLTSPDGTVWTPDISNAGVVSWTPAP